MTTILNRNFKVKGNLESVFAPEGVSETKLIAGVEVQLWHKAPLEKVFLGSGITDVSGDFIIEFEVPSPSNYIVDGRIEDAFLEAYYQGIKLETKFKNDLLDYLVAYWKLDENSGLTAFDSTENGNDGILSGTTLPSWGLGKINNGLMINGGASNVQDSYLDIPLSADFDFGTGDFSFSLWMKLATHGYSHNSYVLDTGYPSPDCLLVEYDPSGHLYLYNSAAIIYSAAITFSIDAWYHIVIRRIGGELELIINNTSFGAVTYTDAVTPLSNVIFGSWYYSTNSINGVMDEIGVWKGHGLSDEQVALLYNSGAGLQYPF